MLNIIIFISLLAYSSGNRNVSSCEPPDGRIVGGVPVKISKHPYQVSLEHDRNHHCGATIISPNWVVTAAHCLDQKLPRSIRLRVGSSKKGRGGTLHQAKKIFLHPQFKDFDHDIAVIKVSKPFQYSTKVKPIEVSRFEALPGSLVTVTGWGALSQNGSSTATLQKVELNILNRKECNEIYQKTNAEVTDQMICASASEGVKAACQGDSGGPAVQYKRLVGIVSWGQNCCNKIYPGVYTNVAVLKNWVTEITGVK